MLLLRGTLAFLAYSSQEGLTGTNITWRGESHSGLVEEGRKNQVFTKIPALASTFLTEKEESKTKSSSGDKHCWREDTFASITFIESLCKMYLLSRINVNVGTTSHHLPA